MKKYKIKVTTCSDTLFAAAEGSAVVDSTTRYDRQGFPFIPAKTFKGLLKESAMEVEEILNDAGRSYIDVLFGQEGVGNGGLLDFQDGIIQGREELKKGLEDHKVSPSEVLGYFTHLRYQTAMEDGVAKTGSLRSSRVLKPDLSFEVVVNANLTEEHEVLLKKACLNLRRVGTNRNRGFGKVKIEWQGGEELEESTTGALSKNIFKLTLESPVLLPTRAGDANTVSSDKVISERKILGMLAGAYLRKTKIKDAHTEATFKRLFLSGAVRFSNAFPISADGQICFPLGQHWVTNKEKNVVESDYDELEGNYKSIGGYYSSNGSQKTSVSTILDFHNSRNKIHQTDNANHTRIQGRNSGDGIYYYEKLDAGQSFVFKIVGEEDDCESIRALLQEKNLRLGKASSTNLGRIKIEEYSDDWPNNDFQEGDEVLLTFTTPVIVKNGNGACDASISSLKTYLNNIIDSRIRTTRIQVFQSNIRMQLPEMLAIAPGSSVKLTVDSDNKISLEKECLGEFTHEGYGQFMIETEPASKKEKLESFFTSKSVGKDQQSDDKDNQEKELDLQNEDVLGHPVLFHIAEQREIIKAEQVGLCAAKTKPTEHKNTIQLMLQLIKGAKMRVSGGKNFDIAIRETLSDEFQKNVYSSKVLENIGKVIERNKEIIEERKDNKSDDKYKSKVINWITNGLSEKASTYHSPKSKIAYWTAYFNQLKINARG